MSFHKHPQRTFIGTQTQRDNINKLCTQIPKGEFCYLISVGNQANLKCQKN